MEEKNKNDSDIEYRRKFLNDLGVYELRCIARSMGIANSSVNKKNALIEKILISEPKPIPDKGRPSKQFQLVDSLKNIESIKDFNFSECDEQIKEFGKLIENRDKIAQQIIINFGKMLNTTNE